MWHTPHLIIQMISIHLMLSTPKIQKLFFYTDMKYKGVFSEGNQTPFVVLYDKKGNVHRWQGGTYKDLVDWISIYILRPCSFCKGSGIYTSHNPDFWLDKRHGEPCSVCHGTGNASRF